MTTNLLSVIELPDGATLHKEPMGRQLWYLARDNHHVRYLNEFEAMFIDAALAEGKQALEQPKGEFKFLPPALHEGAMWHTPGNFTVKISGLTIRQIQEIFEDKYHGTMMWSNGAAYPTDGVSIKFASYAPDRHQASEQATVQDMLVQIQAAAKASYEQPGVAVQLPKLVVDEGRKFMRGEPSLFDQLPLGEAQKVADQLTATHPQATESAPSTAGERAEVVALLSNASGCTAHDQHIIDRAAALLQSTADHIPDAWKMLSEIRDIFPIPAPGSPLERAWMEAMGEPESVPDYVRACVAAMPAGELTDEQIVEIGVETGAIPEEAWSEAQIEFARAILAAARSQPTTEESLVVAGAQPGREPLSDEEMDLICEKALFCRISFQQFARSIEAAHGITKKGAPGAATEQTQ